MLIKTLLSFLTFWLIFFSNPINIYNMDLFESDEIFYTEQKTDNINDLVDARPTFKIETIYYEDIEEEILFGEMELIAQLVMAEAGNQDLTGKRYVVDVVLNRVESDQFPNTVEEVIFQENQFSVIKNGTFDRAGYEITEECYEAVFLEYEERLNYDILYFSKGKSRYMSNNSFKYQDHWFGW